MSTSETLVTPPIQVIPNGSEIDALVFDETRLLELRADIGAAAAQSDLTTTVEIREQYITPEMSLKRIRSNPFAAKAIHHIVTSTDPDTINAEIIANEVAVAQRKVPGSAAREAHLERLHQKVMSYAGITLMAACMIMPYLAKDASDHITLTDTEAQVWLTSMISGPMLMITSTRFGRRARAQQEVITNYAKRASRQYPIARSDRGIEN